MTARVRPNVTVTTSYQPDDDDGVEVDIEVSCHVTGGERARLWGDDAHPGSAPEVEIVSAVGADGRDWTAAIEDDPRWFERVEELAVEAFGEAQEAAADEDDDRAYDDFRDREREEPRDDRFED